MTPDINFQVIFFKCNVSKKQNNRVLVSNFQLFDVNYIVFISFYQIFFIIANIKL